MCKACNSELGGCQACKKKGVNVNMIEIKDAILRSLLDKLIRFTHRCTENGEIKIYSEKEMRAHVHSIECPSKKYKCFCQSESDLKRFDY